jgi:DNA-binding transcriptional MerR regulator
MGLSNLEIQNQITTAFSIWSIKPKDFGVTSRKVNYWKSKGLLPFVLDEKHLVMNIYQGLWFHIIHQLTNLGVSSDELFKLGKKIWYDNQAYDELLKSELNNPHSKLSEHEREMVKGIHNDPVLMQTMRQEITDFTLTLTELFVNNKKQIDFNYYPETNDWALTGEIKDLDPKRVNEVRIAIPLTDMFNKLIATELNVTGNCSDLFEDTYQDLLEIVQRKRPKYVEFIINEKKGKFSCVYESSKTMEDIIRYLRNNDLPQDASIAINKRNASHYVFHIITPHS